MASKRLVSRAEGHKGMLDSDWVTFLVFCRFAVLGASAVFLLRYSFSQSFRSIGFRLTVLGLGLAALGSLMDLLDDPPFFHDQISTSFIAPFYNLIEHIGGYLIGSLLIAIGAFLWGRHLFERDDAIERARTYEETADTLTDRFDALALQGFVWIWETDRDGRFTYLSKAAEQVIGHSVDEFYERRRTDLNWIRIHERDTSRLADAYRNQSQFRDIRYTIITANGNPKVVSIDGAPRFDKSGRYVGYRGTGRDITTQSKTEQALDKIASNIFRSIGQDYLADLARKLCEAVEFDHVYIGALHQEKEGRIYVIAGFSDGKAVSDFDYDLTVSPCREVVGQSTAIYPSGVCEAFPDDLPLVEKEIESYIGVPLVARDGKPLGLIACLSKSEITDVPYLKKIVESFAERAALELERREQVRNLEEERARLSEAQRLGRIGHFVNDFANKTVLWSKELQELTGYEGEAVPEPEMRNRTHPEDLRKLVAARNILRDQGKPYEEVVRLYKKDGSIIWISVSCIPKFGSDGTVIGSMGTSHDITQLKEAELAAEAAREEAQKSYNELVSIVGSLPISLIVYDEALRRRFYNPAYRDLMGYTDEELSALPTLPDMLRNEVEVRETYEGEDFDTVWGRLKDLLDQRMLVDSFEYWGYRKRHIHRKIAPLPTGGWAFALIDISELRTAQERLEELNRSLETLVESRTAQLQESERRYRDIAEISADQFWELDADLDVTVASGSLVGGARGETKAVVGMSLSDLLHVRPDDQEGLSCVEKLKTRLQRHEEVQRFEMTVLSDERANTYHLSAKPMTEDGGFIGYRGSVTDITLLKEVQDELIEAEKFVSLGRLVAGVAHDVNTPLGNALTVSTNMEDVVSTLKDDIESGKLTRSNFDSFIETTEEACQLLRSNLQRAANLIRNFKQVAVDQTSDQRRVFDVAELVNDIVSTLRPSYKTRPIQFEITLPDGMHADSYPGPLGQAITNIIENALTHAFDAETGGTIRLETFDAGPNNYGLAISDDGKGMPPDVVDKAFDPFFTTKLGMGGSGLGLSIVRSSVVNALGGRVRIETSKGNGAKFLIEFPKTAPDTSKENAGG